MKHPLGGKTGTTNDFTDAWFIGFSPSVTCGTWIGFDDRQTLGNKETGARAALPMWMDFMRVAIANKPKEMFPSAGAPKKTLDVALSKPSDGFRSGRVGLKPTEVADPDAPAGDRGAVKSTAAPSAAPSAPAGTTAPTVDKPKGPDGMHSAAPEKAAAPTSAKGVTGPAKSAGDQRDGVSNPPP